MRGETAKPQSADQGRRRAGARLIVCDVDGTLMPYGSYGLPPELFSLIDEMAERGWEFMLASGRQYSSLCGLLGDRAQSLDFICENGALVFRRGQLWQQRPFAEQLAWELIRELRSLEPRCLISTARESLVFTDRPDFYRYMEEVVGNCCRSIETLGEIAEPVLKISILCAPEREAETYELLRRRWSGRCQVQRAGGGWVDCMVTDKGQALAAYCAELGWRRDQVWAYGDNENDLGMLAFAGQAYSLHPRLLGRGIEGLELLSEVPSSLRAMLDEGTSAQPSD